jgi:hypothetical protein
MAGLTELAATTYEMREKKPADAVADNDPLLFNVRKEGNLVEIDGGREIWEDFLGFQNGYYQAIDATEEIALGYNQTITGFTYTPKIGVVPVIITALERAQNQGESKFLDLLKTRLQVGESTFENNLETDLQGDGTGRGGKAFSGIKTYISKTPTTGTVGGVDRATVTSIRNVSVDAVSVFGSATSSSNVESRIRYTKNLLVRNTDLPNLGLAGSTYWNAIGDAMSAKQRYVRDEKMAMAGFDTIIVEGITCVLANGLVFSGGTRIGVTDFYALNTKYFKLKMYKGYNMQPLPERYSVNQLVDVSLQVGIGNFTCNAPAFSGVLFG